MRRVAQQLGRYHIMDRIAFGGMAEIFRAKTFDEYGHEQIVAIKKVLAHFAEDDEFIQMIVDEAKITSLLAHQNIAKIYEFSRYDGGYFLAMEYVDGKDLRSILDKCRAERRRLSIENACFIAAEALLGLHAAHTGKDPNGRDLKIVHRDVSPSNLLISYSGEVKLIDFGIAKASLSRVQTKTGVIKGKVKYMSPEQAMGKKLDGRSDIFSVGAVLYEMLTRVPPFQATSEMDLIFKVREANFRPASEYNPKVPPALDALICKAMARSRSARFQTAWEFYEELAAFLRSYRPDHRRSHLARFLKRLYYEEIEKELRALEEYVVSQDNPRQDAVNLLAEGNFPPTSSRINRELDVSSSQSEDIDAYGIQPPPRPVARVRHQEPISNRFAVEVPSHSRSRSRNRYEPPPDLDGPDLDRDFPRRRPSRVVVDPGPPAPDDELRWKRAQPFPDPAPTVLQPTPGLADLPSDPLPSSDPTMKPFAVPEMEVQTTIYAHDELTPIGGQEALEPQQPAFRPAQAPVRHREVSLRSRFLHERTPSIPIDIDASEIDDGHEPRRGR